MSSVSQNRVIIITVTASVVALGLGVIIGYFGKDDPTPSWVPTVESLQSDLDEEIIKDYIVGVKTDNIKNNLK